MAAGNVIIGQTGRVTASIAGLNVLIAGVVRGNVTAAQRLEIVATGKVWGDIQVHALLIEEGGLFRGQSVMPEEGAPEALPAPDEPPVRATLSALVADTAMAGEEQVAA